MGPWDGCVFILFLRNRSYFIFCLVRPPDMQIASVLTTTCTDFCAQHQALPQAVGPREDQACLKHTTCSPFSSCLANTEASRPSICPRASTRVSFGILTLFLQESCSASKPEPEAGLPGPTFQLKESRLAYLTDIRSISST